MVIEPFELKGKTIKDCYFLKQSTANDTLHFDFEDGSQFEIITLLNEDEITGDEFPTNELQIVKHG